MYMVRCHSCISLLLQFCVLMTESLPCSVSVWQMEEYRGARDVSSLKEFVVMMKAKAAVAVDVGNEGVPEHPHATHEQLPERDDEDVEEDTAAVPGQVSALTLLVGRQEGHPCL